MLMDIRVPSHGHRLVAVYLNGGYICDGCKEKGTGWRYRCHACNYDMHNLYTAGDMQLVSILVERDSLWYSACEKSISGSRYYGSGDALHPCCARLQKPYTIDSITFHLSKNLSSPYNLCAQKNRGWAYVSRDSSIHVHCLIEALQTLASNDFRPSSNHSSLQLCNAPSQLTAVPSTSNHGRSKEASTSWGTLQKQPKRRSNHGVIRAICTTTRLLLKVIYALFFGDPSSLVGEFVTLISNN